MVRNIIYRRVAVWLGIAMTAAGLLTASPAGASATADLTVNPVAQLVNSTTVVVSGTYRCTPTAQGNQGQVSATLKQTAPGGATYSNLGVTNVICDSLTHPYSVTTHGSVKAGPASYHVVLNAVPTGETVAQDGLLTVV